MPRLSQTNFTQNKALLECSNCRKALPESQDLTQWTSSHVRGPGSVGRLDNGVLKTAEISAQLPGHSYYPGANSLHLVATPLKQQTAWHICHDPTDFDRRARSWAPLYPIPTLWTLWDFQVLLFPISHWVWLISNHVFSTDPVKKPTSNTKNRWIRLFLFKSTKCWLNIQKFKDQWKIQLSR